MLKTDSKSAPLGTSFETVLDMIVLLTMFLGAMGYAEIADRCPPMVCCEPSWGRPSPRRSVG